MSKSLIVLLDSLGLENLESEVYIASLSYGTIPASILAKRVDIPRSTARYTCEQLVRKGLMIESKRANTKLFTAENPTKLYALLYAEEEKLIQRREKLAQTVKELQSLYNPRTTLPEVTFYEGVDGIRTMLDELVEEETDLYSFGAGDYFMTKNPELVSRFRSKGSKKYRNIFVIRAKKYREIHEGKDAKNYQTRYFEGIEELMVDIQITNHAIGITSIEENAPMGILIQHEQIVREFQKIFSELWKKSS